MFLLSLILGLIAFNMIILLKIILNSILALKKSSNYQFLSNWRNIPASEAKREPHGGICSWNQTQMPWPERLERTRRNRIHHDIFCIKICVSWKMLIWIFLNWLTKHRTHYRPFFGNSILFDLIHNLKFKIQILSKIYFPESCNCEIIRWWLDENWTFYRLMWRSDTSEWIYVSSHLNRRSFDVHAANITSVWLFRMHKLLSLCTIHCSFEEKIFSLIWNVHCSQNRNLGRN